MNQQYFCPAGYTTKTKPNTNQKANPKPEPKPKPKPEPKCNPKKILSLGLVLGFGLVCYPLGKSIARSRSYDLYHIHSSRHSLHITGIN